MVLFDNLTWSFTYVSMYPRSWEFFIKVFLVLSSPWITRTDAPCDFKTFIFFSIQYLFGPINVHLTDSLESLFSRSPSKEIEWIVTSLNSGLAINVPNRGNKLSNQNPPPFHSHVSIGPVGLEVGARLFSAPKKNSIHPSLIRLCKFD